jgi:2-polyprenyl-3-methyl-5-hydroxy-6-metoxy-1,4-benzoquinol methylase
MSAKTIEVSCDLCGSRKRRLITTENGYPIYKCADCTFAYVGRLPPIEDGRVLGEYYREGEAEIEANRERYEAVITFLLDEAEKLRPCGRILDVGCGFGFFLAEARRRGWEPYGTELSEVAVEYARSENELENVLYADLENADFGDVKFDVINLTNVLEHVPSPTAILEACKARLTDDGILLIRVPNMDFNDVKQSLLPVLRRLKLVTGGGETYYLASPPPTHLTGFSNRTLRRYLDKTGLRIIDVKPSKLSGMANERTAFRILEKAVGLIFGLSFKRIDLSPTILAIAAKR